MEIQLPTLADKMQDAKIELEAAKLHYVATQLLLEHAELAYNLAQSRAPLSFAKALS